MRTGDKMVDEFIASLDSFILEKSADGPEYYVSGYASLPNIDAEQEKVLSDGIVFDEFISHGYFNWDHSHRPEDILAVPIEKGCKIDSKGFFVTGKMLDTPGAQRVIELYNALNKSGRKLLGMSIEGTVIKRNEKNPNIIEKANVRWVAITPKAINRETVKSFQIFAKSFISEVNPLVKQDLERDIKIQTYSVQYNGREIITPDIFTYAVVELTLNNGLNVKDAEKLARKFESLLTEIDVDNIKKSIDYKKVMEAGIKIYKKIYGKKFDLQKFLNTAAKAISMAKDTEDAIGILQRFAQE